MFPAMVLRELVKRTQSKAVDICTYIEDFQGGTQPFEISENSMAMLSLFKWSKDFIFFMVLQESSGLQKRAVLQFNVSAVFLSIQLHSRPQFDVRLSECSEKNKSLTFQLSCDKESQ